MRYVLFTLFLAVFSAGSHGAPGTDTSPPAGADNAAAAIEVEINAAQAFHSNDWAKALPLLKKAVEMTQDPAAISGFEEQIRFCERNLTGLAAANLKAGRDPSKQDGRGNLDSGVATTKQSRKTHVEPKSEEVLDLQIKELGNFDYDADKGGNIPEDVVRLSGYKLRLHGYMLPLDQTEAITRFALVPNLFSCCFGQRPQIQHVIFSSCPKGKSIAYAGDSLVVEGIIKVNEKRDGDYIVSIFELEVTSVKPEKK